jgi:hypothetical protein
MHLKKIFYIQDITPPNLRERIMAAGTTIILIMLVMKVRAITLTAIKRNGGTSGGFSNVSGSILSQALHIKSQSSSKLCLY